MTLRQVSGRSGLAGSARSALLASLVMVVPIASEATASDELFDLSLEALMGFEVTTLAGKAQSIADTAAAVFVIPGDDLRRYGIRSVPEALRLVPGMSVQRIDSTSWSVGGRRFAGRFASKLLVLQDGRPLYTQTVSGVEWDAIATLVDQIERIEVVRGPGSAIWGTNAVNGVVNIITRRADDAPAQSITAGGDGAGGAHLSAQVSRSLPTGDALRGFLLAEEIRESFVPGPGRPRDDGRLLRAGLRGDFARGRLRSSMSAEVLATRAGRNFLPTITGQEQDDVDGGFVNLQLDHRGDDGRRTSLQSSAEVLERDATLYREQRTSLNLDLRHQRTLGRHDLVLGANARRVSADVGGLVFPLERGGDNDFSVFGAFAQDELPLWSEALRLTIGLKVEDNALSRGLDWMPTLRLLWKPNDRHSLWAAVTRAARSPSIAEQKLRIAYDFGRSSPGDFGVPRALPLGLTLDTSANFDSVRVLSVDVGARGQLSERLGYDVTVYRTEFEQLRVGRDLGPFCSPEDVSALLDPGCVLRADALEQRIVVTKDKQARAYGVELALDARLAEDLTLTTAWGWAGKEIGVPGNAVPVELTPPATNVSLVLDWLASNALDAAFWVRYQSSADQGLDTSTWQADAHVNWRVSEELELRLTGRNLFHHRRAEIRSSLQDLELSEFSRGVYLQLRYAP